jgi:AcrR family transcriptional regulator
VVGTRERRKERTRAAIIGAAWQLSLAKGLAATTVAEIADRADVSEQTVYNYFPSKDDIALAVLDDWDRFRLLGDALSEVPDDLGPAEALVHFVRAEAWPDPKAEQEQRDFLLAVERDPQLRDRYRAYLEQSAGVIADVLAFRAGRARMSRTRLLVLCHTYLGIFDIVGRQQPETIVRGRWKRELFTELEHFVRSYS